MVRVFLMVGLLGLSNLLFGQQEGFNYGTRIAIGEASLKDVKLDDVQSVLYLGGGIGTEYRFNEYFSLMTDFLFSRKGGIGSGEQTEETSGGIFGGSSSVTYKYEERLDIMDVDIPLMLKVGYGKNDFYVGVFMGPSLQVNVLGVSSRTFSNANYNEENGYVAQELTSREITSTGLNYGLGISVEANNGKVFYVDVRKNQGLSDIGKMNGKGFSTGYFAVSIAYSL